MNHIGYNIHAQFVPDEGRLKAHLAKVKPSALVVMDGLGLARELAGLPECTVIHRNYGASQGDENLHQRISPEGWLALRAKEADGGIWLYVQNEPPFDEAYLDWQIRLMELAVEQKVRLVVGNWAVGNPGPDDWGKAKRLLELLDRHRDLFILGLHEYACGVITSGLYGGAPNHANVEIGSEGGYDLIQPETWPGDTHDITLWHCGRFRFLVKWCEKNGIKPPRIILTEHGMDDVSDIKAWTNTLEIAPGYLNIRGWKTLRNQWAKWFDRLGWSSERAYFEQLIWADRAIYRNSAVEGQCIFSWGHSSPNWEQFDVAEAFELQERLEAYAMNAPTPVVEQPLANKLIAKPDNATTRRNARALNAINVRYGPGVAFNKISGQTAEILPGNYVRYWLPSLWRASQRWVYVEILTGGTAGAPGWLCLDEFQAVDLATKEIPVMKPEGTTKDGNQKLIELFEQAADLFKQIAMELKNVQMGN